MFESSRISLSLLGTGVLAAALVASPSSATVIVDDSFADGDRAATGPLQIDMYASSNSNAIESNVGSVGLVSGSSGRQIHGLFPTQTLTNTGDQVTLTIAFTTPATVAAGNEDFRIGLFDHLGRNTPTQLAQDTSYSSSSPNADFSGLPGFLAEIDVESADPASDLQIRRSDPSTSGRLLGTTSGFSDQSSGPDLGYAIVADTDYTIGLTIERLAGGALDVTAEFLGESFTFNDASPASYDFNMIALGSSSGAFGSSNSAGDPDNGVDITNVTVTFVPEPASLSLLALGGLAMLRRRA